MKAAEFVTEDYEWEQDDDMNFVNPLPVVDDSKYFEFMDEVDGTLVKMFGKEPRSAAEYAVILKDMANQVGQVTEVPIAQIICTEKYLNPVFKDSRKEKPSSKLPVLYKQGNKYIVGDGNHRVVRAYLDGKNTVNSLVLNTDEILK